MKIIEKALIVILIVCANISQAQNNRTISRLSDKHPAPSGVAIGDLSPDFTVRDIEGKTLNSQKLLVSGPLALVFFQGQWNGDDMNFLYRLNDSLSVLEEMHVQVLALSMENAEFTRTINRKGKLNFPLVEDVQGRVAKLFDAKFTVNQEFCQHMSRKGNLDFAERYGSEVVSMSASSVFVISQDGKIIFSQMDFDSGSRPFVSELTDAIVNPRLVQTEKPSSGEGQGEPVEKRKRRKKKD